MVGLGLDLDELELVPIFDQDVNANEEIAMANGGFKNGDLVLLQQFSGLGQSFFMTHRADLNALGVVELSQLTHLIAAIGQHGQKTVFLLGVAVDFFFARVEQLGWALRSQFEAGFGEVAGHVVIEV